MALSTFNSFWRGKSVCLNGPLIPQSTPFLSSSIALSDNVGKLLLSRGRGGGPIKWCYRERDYGTCDRPSCSFSHRGKKR